MLKHNQRPTRSTQLLGIDIVRSVLQVLHVKFTIHYLLFALEHTDVEGVGTGNSVALAVDNLNGEIDFTVFTNVFLSVDHEFLPDISHRFVDNYIKKIKIQVNAIDADFATLTIEDGYDITAEHTAIDGIIVVQVCQVAIIVTF